MKDRVIAEFPVKAGKRDEFEAALRAALPDTRAFKGCRGIKVFHDAQRDTFVLIEKWKSFEHYDAYLAWRMETGLAEMLEPLLKGGAKALVRGKRRGNLLPAALLAGVPRDADLYRKEAFGPVACIEAFDDFDEAIARVNDSDFGLQAGVFTADIGHAMRAWDRLEVGGVVIGDVPSFRVDNMPYGGIKQSGLGREGVRWAIEDMSETRLLVLRGA